MEAASSTLAVFFHASVPGMSGRRDSVRKFSAPCPLSRTSMRRTTSSGRVSPTRRHRPSWRIAVPRASASRSRSSGWSARPSVKRSGVRRDSSPQASVPADGSSSSIRAPSTRSADLPRSRLALALACTTSSPSGDRASSTPWGWMLPGIRIGSRSQAVRSGAASSRFAATPPRYAGLRGLDTGRRRSRSLALRHPGARLRRWWAAPARRHSPLLQAHLAVALRVVLPVLADLDEQEQVDAGLEQALKLLAGRLADRAQLLAAAAEHDRLLAVAHDVDRLVDPDLAPVRALGPALGLDRDAVGQLLVELDEDLLARDLGRERAVREVGELVLRVEPGPLGQALRYGVEQVLAAVAGERRDKERGGEREGLVRRLDERQHGGRPDLVELVDGEQRRAARRLPL